MGCFANWSSLDACGIQALDVQLDQQSPSPAATTAVAKGDIMRPLGDLVLFWCVCGICVGQNIL